MPRRCTAVAHAVLPALCSFRSSTLLGGRNSHVASASCLRDNILLFAPTRPTDHGWQLNIDKLLANATHPAPFTVAGGSATGVRGIRPARLHRCPVTSATLL
uniref:Putative secreted protein n=1 Tax=Anopheles triannulatus TaxID=58253 RepID=A0A2M4B2A3_9DIPT